MAIETRPERPAGEASQATTPEPSLGDRLGSRFRRWSINPKETLVSFGRSITEAGLRSPVGKIPDRLSELRDRFVEGVCSPVEKARDRLVDRAQLYVAENADKAIDNVVYLKASRRVKRRFKKLVAQGGISVPYSDHQGHGDGLALAELTELHCELAGEVGEVETAFPLQGYAITMAKSWKTGHQGDDLKNSYELFEKAALKKGLVTIPSTRTVDELRYGLSREHMIAELRPFVEKVRGGFGIALLPEGSIQAGRHPEGKSKRHIFGAQKVVNNNLIDFFEFIERVAKKHHLGNGQPFYAPWAVHGSYSFIESLPEQEPKLTKYGKTMLFLAALGVPVGRLRLGIKATMLMPFTEEEVIGDLGPEWRKNQEAFNDYAMRKVVKVLPRRAKGYYRKKELRKAA